MTAPEQLVYTHLAADPSLRFCAGVALGGGAIGDAEWKSLPALRPAFFRYGLQFRGAPKARPLRSDVKTEDVLCWWLNIHRTFNVLLLYRV